MVKKSLSKKENKKKTNKVIKLSNTEINELNKILFPEAISYYLVNSRISKINFSLLNEPVYIKEECKRLIFKNSIIKDINQWLYLYESNNNILRTIDFYRGVNLVNNIPKIKEYISSFSYNKVLSLFTHNTVDEEVLPTLKSNKKFNYEINTDLLQGLMYLNYKHKCKNFIHVTNGKSNKLEERNFTVNDKLKLFKNSYTLYSPSSLNTLIKLAEYIGLESRNIIICSKYHDLRELLLSLPLNLRIQKRGGYMIFDLPYFCYEIKIIRDILLLLSDLYRSVKMFKNNVMQDINTVSIICEEFQHNNDMNIEKSLKLVDNIYNNCIKNKGIPDGLWEYDKFDSKDRLLIDNQINSVRVFSIMNDDVMDDYNELYNQWLNIPDDNEVIQTRRNKNTRYLKKWFKEHKIQYKGMTSRITSLESLFPIKKGVDESKLLVPGFMGAMATPHLQSLVIIEYIERFMNDIYNKSIKDLTITDATAGIGGDSINFGTYFNKVNSVEMSKENCEALKNNIKQYKLTNVKVTCDDYNNVVNKLSQDVVFIDAPWGLDYKEKEKMKLYLGKLELVYFVNTLIRDTDLVVLKVPNNYDFQHFFKKIRKSVTVTIKSMSVLQNYYFYIFCYKLK